jgi:hypothetical protein
MADVILKSQEGKQLGVATLELARTSKMADVILKKVSSWVWPPLR